jgi:hypothetical protein
VQDSELADRQQRVSVVLFQFYHLPIVSQVCGYFLQHVQLFHSVAETREFFVDFLYDCALLIHALTLAVRDELGVFIVFWLTTWPFSVTEEKGEGFENGKKYVLAFVVSLQPWPSSTS